MEVTKWLRHRQTKGAATDMFDLQPPRHISTLRNPVVAACSGLGCFGLPGLADHIGLSLTQRWRKLDSNPRSPREVWFLSWKRNCPSPAGVRSEFDAGQRVFSPLS